MVWATEKGYVKDAGGNTFAPQRDLTRQELVTLVYRFARDVGVDTSSKGNVSGFGDAAETAYGLGCGHRSDKRAWRQFGAQCTHFSYGGCHHFGADGNTADCRAIKKGALGEGFTSPRASTCLYAGHISTADNLESIDAQIVISPYWALASVP